jgi:hypothetical protein
LLRLFKRSPNLTDVDVSRTPVIDNAVLRGIGIYCPKLEKLNLSGATGVTDDGVLELGACPRLRDINLSMFVSTQFDGLMAAGAPPSQTKASPTSRRLSPRLRSFGFASGLK